MSLFIEIREMPSVIEILTTASEKIKQITGKDVTVYIYQGIDGPVNHRALIKEKVKQLVCNDFGVSWEDIQSKSRKDFIVEARHAYMYLMHKKLRHSSTEVANDVNRDHTSVLSACEKIDGYYGVGTQNYLIKKIEFLNTQIADEIKAIQNYNEQAAA